jgi:N-acetyl sugar amidotransferase
MPEATKQMQSAYRQCTRCVMDTSDLEIAFDALGQCNHCTEYAAKTSHLAYHGNDARRDEAVRKMKRAGLGKPYDCVIGISGGVDSCYAALKAKQLGLRALLVHLDNGWNTEAAVKNIKATVDTLGFDYQSYVLNWAEFRALQVAFLRASILDAEIPTDVAIPAACHAVAAEHGVRYVISGGNVVTEGILPMSWGYYAKDTRLIKAIRARFGVNKSDSVPTFGMLKEFYYKYFKGIRTVYLLNLVPFSKRQAIAALKDELQWSAYDNKHGESRYTGFLQTYILPVKFNIDYRRATLSSQICAGEVTRDEALLELEKKPYNEAKLDEDKRYVCKKLEISLDEFEAIMKMPPKTYRDYPNSKRLIELVYGIYRALNKLA